MNTIDRPEGFKEKRAELTVSRIHAVETAASFGGNTGGSEQIIPSAPVLQRQVELRIGSKNSKKPLKPLELLRPTTTTSPF